MAKLVKILLILVAAVFGLGIIGAIVLALVFDPNDYRDAVEQVAYESTGRELSIEGEVSMKVFPWLAVEVGRTSFGNAPGFGDEPMVSFENARLSVEFLPLVMEQRIRVGTATLDGLVANLAVNAEGVSNWEGIGPVEPADAPAETDEEAAAEEFSFDIASVVLSDARIDYSDAQSGSRYSLNEVNIGTGEIRPGEPFDVDGSFDFSAAPADLSGTMGVNGTVTFSPDFTQLNVDGLAVRSTVDGLVAQPAEIAFDARSLAVDTEAERITLGEVDLQALGLVVSADVEPLSYAGDPQVVAAVRVADFSLKDLLARLDVEAPETADPNALEKVSFEARAEAGAERMALSDLRLVLDDTTFTGRLAVPFTENGAITFDLAGDSITVDNYMAPPVEDAAEADVDEVDPEIPADLVRTLNANGTLRLAEAFVGPVRFTDMQVGVASGSGRMRLHPISAKFFDGSYSGDVRIDATADAPTLAVNETISGVNLAAMMDAMYDVQNVTGTIDAGFNLTGTGKTLSSLSSDLDGEMRFELADGEWQGVDVWHQLRSARAIFKREPAPAPRTPARTEFSEITISGPVTDGVFQSDNLLAQLPFIRVTGGGTVALAERTLDYSVQARVLENPEFANVASEDELKDFTQALIPIRIRGPLASPSFRPDIEGIFRQEVERAIDDKKEELKRDIFNRILGGDEKENAGEGANVDGEPGEQAEPEQEQDLEDRLKDRLKNIFPR